MKLLATILLLIMVSFNSLAGISDWIRPGRPGRPGPYDPGRNDRPQISCSARDNGWEEHWGGHSSCRECLAKHGNCIETCQERFYTCEAEGTDYRGYRVTIEARGGSRYSTEREAVNRCQYRYDNCRIKQCRETNETVSRRSCR